MTHYEDDSRMLARIMADAMPKIVTRRGPDNVAPDNSPEAKAARVAAWKAAQ